MAIYRIKGVGVSRLLALSQFIVTSRLSEANTLIAARAWTNGADSADTAAGKTLRETVRKTSDVRILMDADERPPWASGDAAAMWALFKDERSVALSRYRSMNLSAVDFAIAVMAELRTWLTDNYAIDPAVRETWLGSHLVALSAAIGQLQA